MARYVRHRRLPPLPDDGLLHFGEKVYRWEQLEEYCKREMVKFDHYGLQHPDHWRRDPLYFAAKKNRSG